TALVLLVPLAVTSTRGWIRRLGRSWQRLHMLIYPAGVLALLHFYWKLASKSDVRDAIAYGSALALVLAVRGLIALERRKRRPRTRSAAARQARCPDPARGDARREHDTKIVKPSSTRVSVRIAGLDATHAAVRTTGFA